MRRLSLFVALCAAGCSRGPTEVSLNQEFELAVGQSVRVAGTGELVSFESVPSDSRCPTDVTCVWAGNALVRVRIQGLDADSTLELNTTLEPKRGSAGGVQVELRSLDPAPLSTEPSADRHYRVRLLLRRV